MYTRKNHTPPLNALRTFEVFGRHLNLQDAGDELCVSPSAVSKQLRLLEDLLGTRLFERVGSRNRLTEVGHCYLETLSTSFASIDEQTRRLFGLQKEEFTDKGLIIGTDLVFAECWLAPRLGRFRSAYPDLPLELHVNHNALTELPLERVDIEIFTGSRFPDNRHCEKLFQIQDFPVCSPALIADKSPLKSAQDLLDLPLLHTGSTHWWPAWLTAVGCPKTRPATRGMVVQDETLCVQLAAEGVGVALADHISACDRLKDGKLIRPIPDFEVTEDWICLLIPNNYLEDARVEVFRQWISNEMSEFVQQIGT